MEHVAVVLIHKLSISHLTTEQTCDEVETYDYRNTHGEILINMKSM